MQSSTEPEACPDVLIFAQTENRRGPRIYGETQGEPVEEHNAYENRCNEAHFLYPFYRKPSGSASFQTHPSPLWARKPERAGRAVSSLPERTLSGSKLA
jgi:hypothetical protein